MRLVVFFVEILLIILIILLFYTKFVAAMLSQKSPALKTLKTYTQKSLLRLFSGNQLSSNATTAVWRDRFSVAPMMDYTDRHQRQFQRLLSNRSVLYTEMVTGHALVHAPDSKRFLLADFEREEPLILQLGGSDPQQLHTAAKKAVDFGYREINLNVGCPSDRVADSGCFGAALMLQPILVAEICLRMSEVTQTTPTVKCRIGVDDQDSYELLTQFIDIVSTKGGVKHFIVHARKAILGGKFTPDQNRKIPPLKYDYVYRLKQQFPHLQFTINGGINTLEEVMQQLADDKVDGVMVGRGVINNPYHWHQVDSMVYHTPDPGLSRREIMHQYAEYTAIAEKQEKRARRALIKPIWNIFYGQFNGRLFRVKIEELMRDENMPVSEVLLKAMTVMSDRTLDGHTESSDDDNEQHQQEKVESSIKAPVFAIM